MARLTALAAVALLLAGCPSPGPTPPTPSRAPVATPGATCTPRGIATASAPDGRALACSVNGRWYVQ